MIDNQKEIEKILLVIVDFKKKNTQLTIEENCSELKELIAACGGEDPTPEATATAEAVADTPAPTEAPEKTPTETPKPSATPEPVEEAPTTTV